MNQYIAALDQGTTSTRFIVFNRKGEIVAVDQKEHRQIFPRPGWVEHDALEIMERTREVIEGALAKFPIQPQEIIALGITNQRETALVWDRRTGIPYANAVVWQDTRTAGLCADLAREGGQDRFRATTGLPLSTYFSGPKLRWLLENIPSLRQEAQAGNALFGNMDTWLIWNLTGGTQGGVHVTDVTNASRTLLMSLETLDWDPAILEQMQIPRSILPEIRSSSEIYGYTSIHGARIPLCGDLGDQQAALFGQACFTPGEVKNTYGTGCFLLMNTGEAPMASQSGLLTTLGYKIGSQPAVYALEGSIAITGALVQWLRDNLGLIEKSSDVEPLARTVTDSGGIYFVPAFSGLFAPHWRADARGALVGMTRYIHRGHIARAVLEATAYQTREVVEAMEKDSNVHLTRLKVDGGMVSNELLMQFQSDLLGAPVVRPRIAETTALGAAYAAGLATGFWSGFADLRQNWREDREWQPAMDPAQREALYAGWKKAVTRTLDWVEE